MFTSYLCSSKKRGFKVLFVVKCKHKGYVLQTFGACLCTSRVGVYIHLGYAL